VITTLALAVATFGPFTIQSVDRHVAFAGRLGQRVEITLGVERNGETRTLRLARRHTRAGRIPEFQVGERILLPDADRLVAPEEIRRIQILK
jgi:hypothetical protein